MVKFRLIFPFFKKYGNSILMHRHSQFLPRSFAIALVAAAVAALSLSACDSGGGAPGSDSPLTVGFQRSSAQSSGTTAAVSKAPSDSAVVEGTNGTLKITDVRFIVEEFQLKADEDSLDFTASPAFLDLPLDSTDVAVVRDFDVPPETYFEFEFEVDDLDPDEDDSAEETQRIEELLSQIREDFPNWPSDASMLAVGTFTPDGGSTRSFKTFLEAEIEVERELDPPLEVTGEGLSRNLTVKMNPEIWFQKSDGSVIDLSQHQSTDDLLEIENKFKDGVVEVEIGEQE